MDNYLSRLLPRGIGNALRQFLSDSAPSGNLNAEWTPDATDNAKLGLGFTPMLGDAISGYDAYRAAQEGNYGEAALNAVVGYSKGKSGPFLSEVFDVREQAYPDKFGGFRVWEDLYR